MQYIDAAVQLVLRAVEEFSGDSALCDGQTLVAATLSGARS